MQRGGRRGDRAFLAREHRLIVGAVGLVGRPLRGDVGRQRHPPGALEQQLDRLVAVEMKQRRAVLALSRPPTRATPSPKSIVSPTRARLALRRNARHSRGPSRLCSVAPMLRLSALALELRGDDLGVVEHQHVAGPRAAPAGRAPGDRRSRGPRTTSSRALIARPRRPQRDAVGGSSKSKRSTRIAARGAARAAAGVERRSQTTPPVDNFGRLGRRFAGRDPVDRVHARNHPAEDGVIIVQARVGHEHDEELAVGAVGGLRRARRRPSRAGTARR